MTSMTPDRAADDAAAELCLAIQSGRDAEVELRSKVPARRRRELEAVAEQGRLAGVELLEGYRKILFDLVKRAAWSRGRGRSAEVADEFFGAAVESFFEQAMSFDPSRRQTFHKWMWSTTHRRVCRALDDDRRDGRSRSEAQLVRVASGAAKDLEMALHRAPTVDELVDEVRDRVVSHHQRQVTAKALAKANGDLSAAVARRMSKDGISKALTYVDDIAAEVLGRTSMPLSLDGAAGDDQVLGDTIADRDPSGGRSVAERMWSLLSETETFIVERRAGLDGDSDETFREIAEGLDVTWMEVRAMHQDVLRRWGAPHAQFAALAPIVVSVEAPEMSPSQLWRQLHA